MGDGAGNKAIILEKALELFAERGYEAVGVAELCEASLVTKPTLYHYYGSKRGLLDAIIGEKGGVLAARVKEAAVYRAGDYARGVPDGLQAIALAFARFAEEEPDFARLRLSLAVAPPASEGGQAAKALNEAIFEAVEAFFGAASLDHGNMRGRSRPYAAAFIGAVDTLVGLYLAGRGELGDDAARASVRRFMYGIFS
jgi:AcrR family transcriptional regulator